MCLFAFADDYQILNELIKNLKANVPRVKIGKLKKNLYKSTCLQEIKKSNYNMQSSVLTDVSETQLDSSACITTFNNVSVKSESKFINYNLESINKFNFIILIIIKKNIFKY